MCEGDGTDHPGHANLDRLPLRRPGPRRAWLANWRNQPSGRRAKNKRRRKPTGESRPRARLDQAPLTGSELYRFTAELTDRLGVTKELHPRNIRVNSYQISVSRADEQTERQTFLNSYIADDLALISTALDRRDRRP